MTSQHGTFAPERNAAEGVSLGPSRWSGRRTKADAIAETIAAAAELPPPPPREEILSRNRARFLGLAAFVLCGFGLFFGPLGSLRNHHRSFALVEVGALLYVLGIGGISFASRLSRDHRRKRAENPAANDLPARRGGGGCSPRPWPPPTAAAGPGVA